MMYRIVIADDERMIREGLLSLPWEDNGMEVIASAKNGVEVQEIIDSMVFDILLTDIKMPGISGLELAQNLLTANPKAKTVLLSGYGEFEYARKAIELGVHNYILKPSTPEEIIRIVREACEAIGLDKEKEEKIHKIEEELTDYKNLIGAKAAVGETEQQTDIQSILKYIYSHYSENLTLSHLAEQFHFSSVYLSSYIKRYTGHTFLEILSSVRMYHAAKLLRETNYRNREIGIRVGISDERYFGQVFKKSYGITPYEYRKTRQDDKTTLEEFLRRMGQ